MIEAADVSQIPREEQLVVDGVNERHRIAADFDRPFKEKCLGAWRRRNYQLASPWPFWSTQPETETQTTLTETVEAVMASLFSKENFFDLRAVQGQDNIKKEKTKELMGFGLRRQEYAYKLQKYRQTTEATSYGNGVNFHYIEPCIYTSHVRVPARDEWGVPAGYQTRRNTRMEFWPLEASLSRFDLYPATTGADIQLMPFFQHTGIVPLSWLKAMPGRFRNVDRLNGFLTMDSGRVGLQDEELAFDVYERLRAVGFDVKEGVGGAGTGGVEYAELLYETVAPATGRGCDHWRVIGNRSVVLLDEEFPFWLKRKPYSEIKYLERSGNIWQGAGLPELIQPEAERLEIRTNMIGDALLLNSHPMTLHKTGTLVSGDKTELMHWPDRAIEVTDINGIKSLERPHVGQDLFGDLDLSRAGIQRIAKLFDATRNISGARTGMSKGMETATGISIVAQMMNAGVNFKMLWMDETGFADGLRIVLGMVQQVLTREQRVRVQDETNPVFADSGELQDGYITVQPEDVGGEYDIIPVGSTRALEDAQSAEQQRAWLLSAKDLPDVGPLIKQMDAWLAVGELLKVPSPRRFVRTKQEQQQYESEKFQQAMQRQQATAMLAPPAPVPGVGTGVA